MEVLDKYFEKYSNTNNTRECKLKDSNSDLIENGKLKPENDGACRFNLNAFKNAGCLKSNDYGFKVGQPCVVVSLNRLIGWKPEDYAAGEVPAEVAKRYKAGNIAFNCGGMVSFLLNKTIIALLCLA